MAIQHKLFWGFALLTIACMIAVFLTARNINIPLSVPETLHVLVWVFGIITAVIAIINYIRRGTHEQRI